MKKRYSNKWFILVLCIGFTMAQVSAQLKQSIDKILQHPDFEHAEIGISLIDEKGNSVYQKNANKNFIPASLQKIITNFAALETLGPDYQFNTIIGYTGEILPDGNLTGDIIIYGNGDPSLASERFKKRPQLNQVVDDIAKFISKKGITCIDGKVISDASYFGTDGTIHSWAWNDIGNYYACNTWSINVHENYYNLYFQLQASESKAPQILRYAPAIPGLTFENELVSGPKGSGDQSYIFGAPYTYNRYIRGSLPIGPGSFRIKGSIPNSPLYLAQLVSSRLSGIGIYNNGPRAEFKKSIKMDGKIVDIKSPSLSSLVKSANLESINLYCESFLVALGEGDRYEGIETVFDFLGANGIDTDDIYIEDGSGLSVWNNISPLDFAFLLQKLYVKYGDQLNTYFPEAGQSGTLSYLFKGMESNGKLWAKTGSMQQVMNYAGFTTSKSGQKLAFCLISNRHKVSNRKIRKLHEAIMNTIYIEG